MTGRKISAGRHPVMRQSLVRSEAQLLSQLTELIFDGRRRHPLRSRRILLPFALCSRVLLPLAPCLGPRCSVGTTPVPLFGCLVPSSSLCLVLPCTLLVLEPQALCRAQVADQEGVGRSLERSARGQEHARMHARRQGNPCLQEAKVSHLQKNTEAHSPYRLQELYKLLAHASEVVPEGCRPHLSLLLPSLLQVSSNLTFNVAQDIRWSGEDWGGQGWVRWPGPGSREDDETRDVVPACHRPCLQEAPGITYSLVI